MPSVTVTSACVSPRVKTAEPCTRGSTPTSDQIGRISSNLRPSRRTPLLEHFVAQHFFLQLFEDGLRFDLPLDFALGNVGDEIVEHLIDRAVAFELVAHAHGFAERHQHFLFDLAIERVVDFLRSAPARFGLPASFASASIVIDDALDGGVAGLERLHDFLFGDFLRARFDHHEAILAARRSRGRACSSCAARRSG